MLSVLLDRKHQHSFSSFDLDLELFDILVPRVYPFKAFRVVTPQPCSLFHFWVNTTASFRRDGIASVVGTHWLPPQLPFFLPARVKRLFGKLLLYHCATALLLVETDPQVLGFPSGASGKESACQCRGLRRRVQSLGPEDSLE